MLELLYRVSLFIYPGGFRRRYGWQMRRDFREMREGGMPVGRAFVDVLRTAPREWLEVFWLRSGFRDGHHTGPIERIGDIARETRRAVRTLWRQPGFTLVVVTTLGIGIGASTAVFSWTEGLVLRPLPAVKDPSELFTIEVRSLEVEEDAPVLSHPDLRDLGESLAQGGRLAGFGFGQFRVSRRGSSGPGDAERVWGAFVTDEYFAVLGIDPLVGRLLQPDATTPSTLRRVAVISERLWTRRFGRAASAVGGLVQVDGQDFEVVGVAPPDFTGTTVGLGLDIWLPVEAAPDLRGDETLLDDRESRWLFAFGRFDRALTVPAADQHVRTIWERLSTEHAENRELEASVVPFDIGVAARLEPLLWILLGITGLMLLAVCTNVANLVLLRGSERDHEIAVLLALGADRRRVAVRVLAESTILAILGVAAGLGLAALGVRLLPALLPPSPLPLNLHAELDLRVLVFSATLGAVTALLFGAAPAIRAAKAVPVNALKGSRSGGPRSAIQSSALIVVQLAISLATLISAGFFFTRLDQLGEMDRGFRDPDSVFLFPAELADADLRTAWEVGSFHDLIDELRQLPRVESAAISSFVPLGFGGYAYVDVDVPGVAPALDGPSRYLVNRVDEGYLDLMGIPIRAGRGFDSRDGPASLAAVVVNESFVRKHWPGADPIGRGLSLGGRQVVVVGVAGDGKYRFDQFDEPTPPFVYLAWDQWPPAPATIHIRVEGPAGAIVGAVRNAFLELFPGGVLLGPMSLAEYTGVALVPVRLGASVLTALGSLAMGLASLGLYATMAFRVAQRTREVGLRVAIGASRRQVLGMFVLHGAKTAGIGLGLGILLALGIQRVFESAITQFDAGGLTPYATATGVLFLVAMSAAYFAARRAVLITPADALRLE